MSVGLGRGTRDVLTGPCVAGEVRNPKAEARKKAEVRKPKPLLVDPGAEHSRKEGLIRHCAFGHSAHAASRQAGNFGLRVSDFFRVSAFGLRACVSHGSTYTGIPTQTSLTKYSAFQFASRKQPCDSVRPTCSGLGVP